MITSCKLKLHYNEVINITEYLQIMSIMKYINKPLDLDISKIASPDSRS